jgi:hypothetical protein
MSVNSGTRGGSDEYVIRVRPGLKVRLEETENLRDDDPRIPDDRDIHILGPDDLKVAIKTIAPDRVDARASVFLRCG